ncbi:CHAP domain-containing protein [Sphingobacterium sp. LRF_L2]|uniref:CHAP domain-containing protein n=1 Tax=Sphingobacterium sp. LRF_L2 TaxID=3369421 RepID=UPI003F631F3B
MNIILKKNTTHDSVKELKKLLNQRLGTELDENNNFFGASTEIVVKRFQKQSGLIQDGLVGPLTWSELADETVGNRPNNNLLNGVIDILIDQVGVKEKTGKNDGEEVEAYLKSVGLGKGYAWCQAFVFWGFEKASKSLGISNPVAKTAGVLDNWNKSLKYQLPKGLSPVPGDVFVMDFGKGLGHAGVVTGVDGRYIVTVEGNTSADPSLPTEDREGQGVFKRRRLISSINKGFLRYS